MDRNDAERGVELLDAHHLTGRHITVAAMVVGERVFSWTSGRDIGARFPIGSITKSVTAAAVLDAGERGDLDLDAPLSEILPYPLAWGERVTTRHCLAHTSGIPSLFKAHWGLPPVTDADVATAIEPAELVAQFAQLPLRFAPGSRFEYCNSGYVLASLAVEAATQKPMDRFHFNLFDPTSRAASATVGGVVAPVIHPSWQLGAGDLEASVGELAAWHLELASGSRPWRETMFEAHTPHYGYGWRVGARLDRPVAWHEGVLPGIVATLHRTGFGDAAAIVMTDSISERAHGFTRRWLNRVADQLVAIGVGEEPLDRPAELRPFSPEELSVLPGNYSAGVGRELAIEPEEGGLRVRTSGDWLIQHSEKRPEIDELAVAATTRRFTDALVGARWGDAFELGSSTLRNLLTPDSLRGAWEGGVTKLGSLQSLQPILVTQGVGWFRCRFAKAVLDLAVSTDEGGASVGGFHLVAAGTGPASISLRLVADVEGRMYADGFEVGAPDTWVELEPNLGRATVAGKYC